MKILKDCKRLGMFLAAGAFLFPAPVRAKEQNTGETVMDYAMGVECSVRIYGKTETARRIINRLHELEEKELSWRIEGSDLYELNQSAGSREGYRPTELTMSYLEAVWKLSEDSGGAFDITVGELSKLWGLGTKDARIPEAEEIKSLQKNTGYERVSFRDGRIFLPEGMSLDLGAVGKGIGCQEAQKLLEEEEADAAMVAVGGSILLYGRKPDGTSWKVGIANPREETGESYLGVLTIDGTRTVSTSGDYEKYLMQDGIRYHHILDPDTGYPADSGLISVTIVCSDGWLGDGLSTACFVLGYEKSLELLEAYQAEAVFVTDEYQVMVTDGLADSFTLSSPAYTLIQTKESDSVYGTEKE